ALAAPANAEDVSFKLEPGVVVPLTAPQSNVFSVGAGQSLKALFGVTSFLDVGPTGSFLLLPATKPKAESGVAWSAGAGLRLERPHDGEAFAGISPWLDADALYVRNGPLNRTGFGIANSVDRCPAVFGSSDNGGCPAYAKIVVQQDKLELKEKLYFAWDQATLEDASLPVLDEVAQALTDNKAFRVQIDGHTDSSG